MSTRESTACDPATSGITPSYPYGNYIAVYSINGGTGACSTELTTPNTNNTGAAFSGADTCTTVAGPLVAPSQTNGNAAFNGQRAAYVLISHGQSGWYAWPRGGGSQFLPPGTYALKQYNSGNPGIAGGLAGSAGNLGFVQGNPIGSWPPKGNTNYFDDIVRWRSPAFIIQQCGAGACGNP